ncbi:hypothetical protein RHGRI_015784 [Rhododendron griersonianum]|uniref:Bms1-type G domain-containing protein n=1 Tax=Rhododendron griersonianum TaxID=479676 RepID=A0AAV6JNL3_9ERIC|nr:hypothetical protein RHGRI_015784 [Rhododendron griersonianum]
MAGSRVQVNKAHKTRFASKSSRNIHKTSLQDKSKISKTDRNVAKGARNARIQRNKMIREQKRAALLKEKRASSASTSPPRVIVLFGLSASVNLNSLSEDIFSLLSAETVFPAVASPEYKLRTTVLKAPHGDLLSCMEMAKVADLIAFVASASSSCEESNSSYYIDSFGKQCLSVFRVLGLPSTVVLIRDLPNDLKRRHDTKKTCTSSLVSEFPEDCKFYPADMKDELHKFMWLFKEQRLTVPHWRDKHPYLMAQKVDLVTDGGKSTLLLTGYLRTRNLSVNQLVHVSGAGDFQLCKVELLKDPCPLNARKDGDLMDADEHDVQVIRSLVPDPMKQEPLLVENVPDPLAGEQTWPTEAEMADADRNREKKLRKRTLPRGTSEYQAAWIVDDSDVDDSDSNDDTDDGMVLDRNVSGFVDQECNDKLDLDDDQASLQLESDEETEVGSVVMEGENFTKEQIEDEIRKIKEAHAEDEEFPDEVDTPIDVPARRRFAKFRGLKSFRTSSWDPKESLPPEYAKIFAFDNFTRTQKHVLAKALDTEQGDIDDCIPASSYARLHIKEVPTGVASKLCRLANTMPIIACGLLQHESKVSVLHFSVKKHDTYTAPIKSKEELIFHVGFRQFICRPIFSTDNSNSDKHKMERFLHAGQFSVASIYAPISFPPLPLVVLKREPTSASPSVAAVGSLRSIDPDRIILKRIILTGYPQRVSKKKATVKYMFHKPEDVRWFKPVEVWTKCGRRGRITEPLGTHGHRSSGYGKEPVSSVQMQIVNALCLGERSRASSLLSDIGRRNIELTANDFVYILEYCARSTDPLFVMETWRTMGEKDVDLDDKCYLLIIRALCKGGYLEEALNMMDMLRKDHDLYPILSMYNNLLGGCARIQSVSRANECLDLMERRMVGKNEITYTELLKLAVLQENLPVVHEIWKEYIKYYSPSITSLRKFVWAFSRLRDLEAAYIALQHMVSMVLRGGFIVGKTAEGKLFTLRLDIPIPSSFELDLKRCSEENEDPELYGFINTKEKEACASNNKQGFTFFTKKSEAENDGQSMMRKCHGSSVMKVLRWSFNDVIHACALSPNCRLAEQLILQMQNMGLEPSSSTYDGLIRAVVSERGFHDGIEVLKSMQCKNLKPHDSTLATIAVGCSEGLELDLAEALLDQISKSCSVHPYNAFLKACDTLDRPERAVHALVKMKEMKLQPNIRTYELLFSLFGNVNAPYEEGNMLSQVDVAKRIHAIEMDMVKNGIQHSHWSMRNLLKALGAEGMVGELIQYLRVAENQFSRGYSCLGTASYNIVLHSLVEANESHMAVDIFKSMKSCGFLPDAATYNIMIDCCSIVRCFKSASVLVSLMLRDGFYPQAVTYTALIKILLGNGDFDKALSLLDQGSLEGIQYDVLLFNTVLREACEKGRIDVIELIAERMHQKKVQPDPSTCYYVFSAYVNHDYISTAIEALQVLSMRMISEEDSILEERRTEYEENFIFSEDMEAESRILELFKDCNENLAVALLYLRWCATLGYEISWLPNRSLWARRLSSNYANTEGVAG